VHTKVKNEYNVYNKKAQLSLTNHGDAV